MGAALFFNYEAGVARAGFLELPDDWEYMIVAELRIAIWEEEKREFELFRVVSASCLSLWKEGDQKALSLADNLQEVFDGDVQKTLHVTPSTATVWNAAFVARGTPAGSFTNAAGTSGAASGDTSSVLAKQLLAPFRKIPKSVEEVRRALETPPLQRIPLREEYFKLVACRLASRMFTLETPEVRAVHISTPTEVAINFCLRPSSYAEHLSGNALQSYWDCIFCNLWTTLLDLAGIKSIRYSRDTASGRSDLSLLVHGKEVFYGEEDAGLGINAVEEVRKKSKGFLDPQYYLDMSHMTCFATEDLSLRVLAVSKAESVALLPVMYIQGMEGLLRSIMLSINLLRLAVTWARGFANTPASEEQLDNTSTYTYGPRNSIQ